ncbi:hypothetical protein PHJA_001511000 [Phtheirospermum japonicum]|uniref:Uncharacterized protein n=1 Tax=Phtheirospermum japonicum TaxID=374723 RepID=A0A830C3M4_9LAMI|nr:hypothetical protein PHJA_001511000 [Phtheirospermum japonicum]
MSTVIYISQVILTVMLSSLDYILDEYYTFFTNETTSHCKNNGDSYFQEFESDDLGSNVLLMGCSELDSHWIGLKKIEPWWDAVDKDDREIFFDRFEEQMKDKESIDISLGKRGLTDCILPESDLTLSFSSRNDSNASKSGSSNTTHEPSGLGNINRAQLLEALCHSQTRARKAEKLAQDACNEKDDIINLFFQQASCLFAYKQWLRLLQMETMCLHLRTQNQPANPGFLPQARNNGPTSRKMKWGKTRRCISKWAVAFAVGFGLASAGLLVGWTIGWLFPAW